ncbi:MATE family efflux transporter [Clostridium formicaceticum]|uniref:Probable multidrug resistance protein NorM n=1 Tax=Clostridium formicaceticum TaxID=1497 RepID=A0AAC9RMT4_9CLOT|nr:MATE family efflux transporter [Clostridium formicaceticum]AOY77875.1 MATE family efflux transporter [Clostridium formicaceticum]ARE88492.1 Multidrug export protein MepA [Clostridium formicaceticum]
MKKLRLDFLKYTSLNVLAMVGVSLYILADTYFISKALGAIGLAALNFCIVIFTLIQGVGLMIGIGGAIDFSIGDSERSNLGNKSFVNALFIGSLFSVIFILLGVFFSTQISLFLGADELILSPTKTYLTTILGFSPFFILNNIGLAFVRNDKNPRLTMTAMIVSSFSNIILDYVFMFPLSMGIFGAAFATGLSPIISLCILTFHFRRNSIGFHLCKCRIEIKRLIRIITLGLPSFVTELASSITLFTFNIVILRIAGNVGVAAYSAIANVATIATALFTGLAQGIQPLAGNYFANSDKGGLRTILKYSLITSFFLSITIYFIILVFSDNIILIFNSENNEALARIAGVGLKIYFTGFIFAGINIVIISFLSAISNTVNAMVISILRSSIILIPTILFMSFFFKAYGIWASFMVAELLVTIFTYLTHIYRSRENIQLDTYTGG